MPSWPLVFFVAAVIAALLGLSGLVAPGTAQVLFVASVILFLAALVLGKH